MLDKPERVYQSGTVKFYHYVKDYGFIVGEDGTEYYFKSERIKNLDPERKPRTGDPVIFYGIHFDDSNLDMASGITMMNKDNDNKGE